MKVASIVLAFVVAASAAPINQFFPDGIDKSGFFGQDSADLFDHSSSMSGHGSASHPAVPQAATAAESITHNPPSIPLTEPLPKSNSIPKPQNAASKPKLSSPLSIKVPPSNRANPWVKPDWADSIAATQKRRHKPLIAPRAGAIALNALGVATVGAGAFAIQNYFLHKQKEAKVGIVPVSASAGSANAAA